MTASPSGIGGAGRIEGPRRAVAADLPAIIAMQQASYQKNAAILGVEPLPLRADYTAILKTMDVWLWQLSDSKASDSPAGILILHAQPEHMLIWSVAVHPGARGLALGNTMLAFSEDEARKRELATMRLYTGEPLTANIAWYTRKGYSIERREALADRTIVHMVKSLHER